MKNRARSARLVAICCLLAAACQQQEIDDAALTAKVKASLIADGRVSATRVSVETASGVVTLKGEVPTEQEKQAAEQAARTVSGVKSVKNEVKVNPAAAGTGVPPVDELKNKAAETAREAAQGVRREAGSALLLANVKARLTAAGFGQVSVEINGDQATLTGEVKNDKERIAAETIVEKVEGIKRVNNQLKVKPR
jgi:osmotically-inducible protein OsmY